MTTLILTILLAALLFAATLIGGRSAAAATVTLETYAETRKELRQRTNRIRDRKCRPDVHHFAKWARFTPPYWRASRLAYWRGRVQHARGLGSSCVPWYVTKQIWAGNILGRESAGDPWPNCPDPYDGSGSGWQGTVNCENGGSWLDSPGFYRCGLQFHPNWENRFGRLCP